MPANPTILSALNDHFTAAGTSFDGGPGPKKPIPLPDYSDPASRLRYAKAVQAAYGLPDKSGDIFLHFNEVPDTRADTLTSGQLAAKYAKASGLPASLLYSSAMDEGMTGLYPYGPQADVDWSGDEKYPVSGFRNFGLDTFSGAYPDLVRRGYLAPEFKSQFQPTTRTNEKGQKVSTANFASADSALAAKAAMIRAGMDDFSQYAKRQGVELSPRARNFLALAAYNGGPGAAQGLLREAINSGGLKDDAFFTKKPASSKWGEVWDNVNRRFQYADTLDEEKYPFEDVPPSPPATPAK